MAAVRPKLGMSASYLYQTLVASEAKWVKLSQGSTFDAVTTKEVKKQKIKAPVLEKEQEEIAAVLDLADGQITTLTETLQLIRAEKLYLMQQLLTEHYSNHLSESVSKAVE